MKMPWKIDPFGGAYVKIIDADGKYVATVLDEEVAKAIVERANATPSATVAHDAVNETPLVDAFEADEEDGFKRGWKRWPEFARVLERRMRQLHAKLYPAEIMRTEERAHEPVRGVGLIRKMRDQRDEIYDAACTLLRHCDAGGAVHIPDLDALRAACAKVPDYQQRLDNILNALAEDGVEPSPPMNREQS